MKIDFNFCPQIEETEILEESLDLESITSGAYSIILYNDEVNTFDHVIECLVELCEHTTQQAEQCALFVHFKGKYQVKSGNLDDLFPICTALCDRGLSAVVE